MRYSFLMSYRDDEKRWKRIQEMLLAEASGKTVRPMVSQRTLFGIPSTVEQTIERIVAEDEEECRARGNVPKVGKDAVRRSRVVTAGKNCWVDIREESNILEFK